MKKIVLCAFALFCLFPAKVVAANFLFDSWQSTGTVLEAHTPEIGAQWTRMITSSKEMQISTQSALGINVVVSSSAGTSYYISSGTPTGLDQTVDAQLFVESFSTSPNRDIGLMARAYSNSNNPEALFCKYIISNGNNFWQIIEVSTSTTKNGTQTFENLTAGTTEHVLCNVFGSSASLVVNGVTKSTLTGLVNTGNAASVGIYNGDASRYNDNTHGIWFSSPTLAYPYIAGIVPGAITVDAAFDSQPVGLPEFNTSSITWTASMVAGTPSGGNGVYTYQWYASSNVINSTSTANIVANGGDTSGAATNTLIYGYMLPNTTYYFIVAVGDTGGDATVLSTTATYVTPLTPTGQVIIDGNSLSAGYGTDAGFDIAHQLLNALNGTWAVNDWAVSGQTWPGMDSTDAPHYDSKLTKAISYFGTANVWLYGWEDTNDIQATDSSTTVISDMLTWKTNRLAVNPTAQIALATCLPRAGSSGAVADFETVRQAILTNQRSNWAAYGFKGFIDFAAYGLIGFAGDNLSTTYYNTDHIHLNDLGQSYSSTLYQTILGPTILTPIANAVAGSGGNAGFRLILGVGK